MSEFAGVDVAGRRGSHLCLLRPLGDRLEATFYERGPVEAIAKAIAALGQPVVAIDAPQSHRLDLLAEGQPLRGDLGLAQGRYAGFRVCDALLTRRGLPLYQVPRAGDPVAEWMLNGFRLFELLASSGLHRHRARSASGGFEGPVAPDAHLTGRVIETYPDAGFCALIGERPPAKSAPAGFTARVEALAVAGVVDGTDDLRERSLDELDACVSALAAVRFAQGKAYQLGAAEEGVIVLPVVELKVSYVKPKTVGPSRKPLPKAL